MKEQFLIDEVIRKAQNLFNNKIKRNINYILKIIRKIINKQKIIKVVF